MTSRQLFKIYLKDVRQCWQNNIERFLDGQRFGYGTALAEIRAGQKRSHWIWYVFPQLKGLGHSPNSVFYGIDGLGEAKEYLSHPVLGQRLREITQALLDNPGKDIECIMPGIDAVKLKSSMTLFDAACPDDIFNDVLQKYYGGQRDQRTLEMIAPYLAP